jgi:hypothetical protein
MDNAETVATLGTQYKERKQTKQNNTTQKNKTMSNMAPTKKPGANPDASLSFTGKVMVVDVDNYHVTYMYNK